MICFDLKVHVSYKKITVWGFKRFVVIHVKLCITRTCGCVVCVLVRACVLACVSASVSEILYLIHQVAMRLFMYLFM